MKYQERFGHRNCTFILPAIAGHELPKGSPAWWRERTHGCWCSSWRLTSRGWRVRRKGRWAKPRPGELRRHKARP